MRKIKQYIKKLLENKLLILEDFESVLPPDDYFSGNLPNRLSRSGTPSPRHYLDSEKQTSLAKADMFNTDDQIEAQADMEDKEVDFNKMFDVGQLPNQVALESCLTSRDIALYNTTIKEISSGNVVASGGIIGVPMTPSFPDNKKKSNVKEEEKSDNDILTDEDKESEGSLYESKSWWAKENGTTALKAADPKTCSSLCAPGQITSSGGAQVWGDQLKNRNKKKKKKKQIKNKSK